LVRLIKDAKLGSILAVDADPNSNLAQALGIEAEETIGDILDEILAHPEKIPAGMGKDQFIEFRAQSAISEKDGFDLITMGRPEGQGCYCYVNNTLRNIMGKLIKDYDYIIIDNEAGLEHLSRRTSRSADSFIVVSDPTAQGLRAAGRISQIVRELKIKVKKEFLLLNRAEGFIQKERFENLGLEYLGAIPPDKEIEHISLTDGALINLKADSIGLKELGKLGERIWHQN
jgi:CO dehydrogenase maturation factor